MEGRTTEQKARLSQLIISKLSELQIDISFLSINISDFEQATYSNKSLINPDNKNNDRHFELWETEQLKWLYKYSDHVSKKQILQCL